MDITFNPGLNVLIGPNGAGKTNVLALLDFMSDLVTTSPNEAVNRQGGLGGVFERKPFRKSKHKTTSQFNLARTVDLYLEGAFGIEFKKNQSTINRHYLYEYQCILRRTNENEVVLEKQEVIISERKKESSQDYTMILSVTDDGKGNVTANCHDQEALLDTRIEANSESEFCRLLSRKLQLKNKAEGWQKECLISRLAENIFLLWIVENDIRHGERITISPDVIRNGDDFSVQANVDNNGAGAIKTLHRLRKGYWKNNTKSKCKNIFNEILEELKLAVSNVCDIDIDENLSSGKYELNLTLQDSESNYVKVPARFVSEGTLKWLVLVTLLKTNSIDNTVLMTIEEPENFLHPWMQSELIRIIRELTIENIFCVLLSTHSETLLNELEPDEILITKMVGAKTKVNRPTNKDLLQAEIENSGFKLGYFYVSGAVEDE